MNHEHEEPTPRELREVEAALGRLAEQERASAPAGFDEQLSSATRPRLVGAPEVVSMRLRPRALTAMRLAAAVLIAATLALIVGARWAQWPAGGSGKPGPVIASGEGLEDDVELWLTLRTPDRFEELSEGIDSLYLDTTNVGGSFSTDWPDLLDTGAL